MSNDVFKELEKKIVSRQKRRSFDEIIEILLDQVKHDLSLKQVCIKYGVTQQTVYIWRKKYKNYIEILKENKLKEITKERESRQSYNQRCGLRLKKAREKLKLTQASFSDILQITQGTYSGLELGKIALTAEMIKALYEAFGINPTFLILDRGDCFSINNIEMIKKITKT